MNNVVNNIEHQALIDLFDEIDSLAERSDMAYETDNKEEGKQLDGWIQETFLDVIKLLGPKGTLSIIEGRPPILSIGNHSYMIDGEEIDLDDYMWTEIRDIFGL